MPPHTHHVEKHFAASETVRDVVIGMADGLTVPFALAAGLSGAVTITSLVVIAGLAEIAAGAVAMGLGGYLAAKSDAEHYKAELAREYYEVDHLPDKEREEITEILEDFGLQGMPLVQAVEMISADKDRWVNFMMKNELGLEKPDPKRAYQSALTIGGSYIAGGMIPLASYMVLPDLHQALVTSAGVTAVALFVFGAVKARLTGMPVWKGGLQTLLVGALAAGVAFTLARLIS